MASKHYDWQTNKHKPRFAWKNTTCKEYKKDRDQFFQKNGNGWWWTDGVGSSRFQSQVNRKSRKRN